jgi:hypothetical protein
MAMGRVGGWVEQCGKITLPLSDRCFKQIWKVGKVDKVGKVGKVDKIGKVGKVGKVGKAVREGIGKVGRVGKVGKEDRLPKKLSISSAQPPPTCPV